MKAIWVSALAVGFGLLTASTALAECKGSNGRGWGSGKGEGKFEMAAKEKVCQITFPGFIDDAAKTRIPATEVKLTRAPKNGTIGIVKDRGLVYTPAAGFRGNDSYCGIFTSPKKKGSELRGCVTISVK